MSGWTRELFYKPYKGKGGVRRYKRNSRKLWAFVGGLLFVLWMVFLCVIIAIGLTNESARLEAYPWGALAAITGTLAANFQFAVGLYTWSKKIDNGQDGACDSDR